ncbi:MAG: hypothetical protein HOI95_25240 [Chromatiales bacterium]|jgi:hypothetical protein|nr:hypothetical protein [Chromatiales bacterium]
MGPDIASVRLLYLKAALFVVITGMCAALLVMKDPHWQTAALVMILAWSAAAQGAYALRTVVTLQ